MRSPDPIHVLLKVRLQREEVEERKLIAIVEKLRVAQAELADLSRESERITTARSGEIQRILPNTHHQAVEAHLRALWHRCADLAAEIERLREVQAKQMSAYLSAHREREVLEGLNKRRRDALDMQGRQREQKLNEDLFLARRVAKSDT